MSRKNVNFGDKKIKKSDFYKNKKSTKIDDLDVNEILVSTEEPYGTKRSFKYSIGYNDNDVIRTLCITGDNDKYIKAKIKYMLEYVYKFSEQKSAERKSTM